MKDGPQYSCKRKSSSLSLMELCIYAYGIICVGTFLTNKNKFIQYDHDAS